MEVRRVAAVWANGGCYASAPRADAERAAHPSTTTVISRYTSHAPAESAGRRLWAMRARGHAARERQ